MLINLITQRKFKTALNHIKDIDFKNLMQDIQEAAFIEEDIVYYDFLNYMIQHGYNTAELHYYASEFMATTLNFLPNAYKIAFEHGKKAIELNPNDISLKEYIILFYDIPDQLLDKESAIKYAQEILAIDSGNKTALRVLS